VANLKAREDPAEAVARIAAAKREVLLNVHRGRLGREDLEDCFSQATLELVARARARDRAFDGDGHILNALEQKFLSRISDRRRAVAGRSPIEAELYRALRQGPGGDGGGGRGAPGDGDGDEGPRARCERQEQLAMRPDPRGDVAERQQVRHEVRRLRELADELTKDQRLVLACQVWLDMDCVEFCARFGWSPAKFRKVAQRARARLRTLAVEYDQGARCQRLLDDLNAYVAHVASAEQTDRVRIHLANCPACAQTAAELGRTARGVASVLPVPAFDDGEFVHRLGVIAQALHRLLPFWDSGETATAAKTGAAGAAAAAGGGAGLAGGGGAGLVGGGATLGIGATKLGIAALCAAGAAGSYAVCQQVDLLGLPTPAAHHRVVTKATKHRHASKTHQRPRQTTHAPVLATAAQAPQRVAPVTRSQATSTTHWSSAAAQASSEFGIERSAGGSSEFGP
jgi:DNA-directed RNA polymerase specialized sigma24 family protein